MVSSVVTSGFPDPKSPIRLMSWNLLEGFFKWSELGDQQRHVHEDRITAAQILVARYAPDILVINEALYCEEVFGQRQDYAALFGFEYAACHLYDGAWGNAILSRMPMSDTRHVTIHRSGSAHNRGFLATRVDTPQGRLWVSTYHPHPRRRPHKRSEDFSDFLSGMDGPAILCGDLNAITPEDDPDVGRLVEAFRGFQKPDDAQRSVSRFIDAGRMLFEAVLPHYGWRDAMPMTSRDATIPTRLIAEGRDSDMRIDHVLVSRHIDVVDARIIREPEADLASDHYPVVCDLCLPAQ